MGGGATAPQDVHASAESVWLWRHGHTEATRRGVFQDPWKGVGSREFLFLDAALENVQKSGPIPKKEISKLDDTNINKSAEKKGGGPRPIRPPPGSGNDMWIRK